MTGLHSRLARPLFASVIEAVQKRGGASTARSWPRRPWALRVYQLNAKLWKAPQAIFAMLVAPGTGRGCLLTFIEKSPHGSPHVHTCSMHQG